MLIGETEYFNGGSCSRNENHVSSATDSRICLGRKGRKLADESFVLGRVVEPLNALDPLAHFLLHPGFTLMVVTEF